MTLTSAGIASPATSARRPKALGNDRKGKITSVLHVVAIVLAFVKPWISLAIYALVALRWLVPDRRIERRRHRTVNRLSMIV